MLTATLASCSIQSSCRNECLFSLLNCQYIIWIANALDTSVVVIESCCALVCHQRSESFCMSNLLLLLRHCARQSDSRFIQCLSRSFVVSRQVVDFWGCRLYWYGPPVLKLLVLSTWFCCCTLHDSAVALRSKWLSCHEIHADLTGTLITACCAKEPTVMPISCHRMQLEHC